MFWGSFYTIALSVSHIEEGCKKFPFFKQGERNDLPCLEGRHKKFRTQDFPIL